MEGCPSGREELLTSAGGPQDVATAPVGDRLSLRRLVRAASGLSLATLVSPALALPAGILAARWLGPDRYGRAQAVLFFFVLASLLRSGVFEGGVRAYVHLSASGDEVAARRAQNVAFTLESIVSGIPGVVLLSGYFLVDDGVRRVGFLLAPLAVLATSVASYLAALHVARERFATAARSALIRAVVGPVALLLLIPTVGAIAIVLAPLAADVTAITVLALSRPRLGLKLELDASVARPLVRTGFPLGMAAVVYWAYRLAGSGTIALARSPLEYGIFAFAATPVTVLARGVSTLHTVLMPAVWAEMADIRRARTWARPAARATILLAVASGALTSAGQAGFGPVVHVVAPKFIPSISLFDVLAFNILFLSVGAVPSLVLDSTVVNRQVRHLAIWVVALVVNVAANAVVLASGAGLLAVAVNDIWVQVVVLIAIFATARRHLPDDWPGRTVLVWVTASAAVTVVLLLGLRSVWPDPQGVGELVRSLAVRLGLVAVAWSAVGLAFRRLVTASGGSEASLPTTVAGPG